MNTKPLLLFVVIVGGCIIAALLFWPPKSPSQEVAKALLGYHHQFTTNGYSEVGLRVPDLLRNRYGPAGTITAETNCVAYKAIGRRLGLPYGQVLYLSRSRPSDINWTLGGSSGLELPLCGWASWRHRSIVVTSGL